MTERLTDKLRRRYSESVKNDKHGRREALPSEIARMINEPEKMSEELVDCHEPCEGDLEEKNDSGNDD
jgi:hypothetical protein